jgi:YrbI family 3-deoxy-D-manno-octulosonate 8-phosphate phosphatase
MLRLISHRGNLSGPIPKLENNPEYIISASLKYNVEIDVWFENERFYLGHDKPTYEVDKFFLFNSKFLIHCKSLETFIELKDYSKLEAFYQEDDLISMTTQGRALIHSSAFSKKFESTKNIQVHLGSSPNDSLLPNQGIILTDYPDTFKTVSKIDYKPFDLLILDVDGVLTDGTKLYDHEHRVAFKTFNDKDFTAIKRFQAHGVTVVFLSGDKSVNEGMAISRQIPFFFSKLPNGNIDKSVFLETLKERYGAQTVAYVGDDYYDQTIIDKVDYAFCPTDAISDIQKKCTVLTKEGGKGVIAELFDITMRDLPQNFAYDTF